MRNEEWANYQLVHSFVYSLLLLLLFLLLFPFYSYPMTLFILDMII